MYVGRLVVGKKKHFLKEKKTTFTNPTVQTLVGAANSFTRGTITISHRRS